MGELYIGNNKIGGGSADLSNYYTKSEIDSSFGETYLVKITNSAGYYCYVPRTMSDADKEKILSSLNTNGGIAKFASSISAFIGTYSNADGYYCTASGDFSHAEGRQTTASGRQSHAEGDGTTASGISSHAEGNGTTASATYGSHAEGSYTTASGNQSHAEGQNTTASGNGAHAEGYYTNAKQQYQHAEGKYNADAENSILIVGNGTGYQTRHNALEVHLSGDVKISDTHAAGEAYQKPMFVLQDKLYQIDSSVTALEANSGGTPDLTDYYTKSEVDDLIPTVPTTLSSFTNDSGFITNNDTSIYALKSELPTVPTAISSFTNDTGFITDNDTSIYALKSELPIVPTAISSFTNDTGYVTDNDISTFVTASNVYDKNYIDTSLNSIESRLNNSSSQQVSFQVLTQAQYAALTPNSNTIYFITN